jgi:hypothetical protein
MKGTFINRMNVPLFPLPLALLRDPRAVEALTEALADELAPLGIAATLSQ